MVNPRSSVGLLLIESSAFSTPLGVDDDHVVDGCAWLAEEVRKWLPGGEVAIVFPTDDELTPWARGIRGRLSYIGVPTSDKDRLAAEPRRTRMLWHVHADHSSRAEDYRFTVRPDRVDSVVVPLGEIVPWQTVASRVIEYASVMGVHSTYDTKLQDFDAFGVAQDEEPF